MSEDPAEVRIPSVEMHNVGIDFFGVKIKTLLKCCENGLEGFRGGIRRKICADSVDRRISPFFELISKAANLHFADFCQLACQILDMNTGASVDVRRILVGEKQGLHRFCNRAVPGSKFKK